MKVKWIEKKLSEIAIMIDYRGKTPQKTEKGIPLITAKIVKNGIILPANEFIAKENYASWMTRGYPLVGDVVLTTEAPLGEVAQLREANVALAQRIITIRGKEGILDNSYLKYFLQSSVGQARLRARETGTTVTGIKASELREISIPVPDIKRQQQIAKMLLDLDEKIYNTTQINHNLEEQARCHFAFLSYNAREQCDLENVANLNPKRNLQKGKIASCYEMVNLSSTSSSPLGGMQKIFNGGMKFKNGDTLLARITPCLENGKAAYINCLNENEVAFGSTEYIVIESKGRIPSPFFYCLIRDSKFREFAIKNMNGSSGRQRVSAETIGKYQVPVLSDEDIKRFAKHVLPLFDMIRNNAMETQRLIHLRDSLLPKLMSGEIDVSKVEV